MKATVDRLEGDMAVLLVRDGERIKFNVPVALLPEGVRKGDVLDVSITIDEKATEDAKARVSSLMGAVETEESGRFDHYSRSQRLGSSQCYQVTRKYKLSNRY